MPLYEYECDNCGHRFEVIQKFSDTLITECPKCQGAVRKLFSSPAIQFKGSGWYITDYAKKSGTGAGAAKGEGSSETSGAKPADSAAKSGDAAPKTDGGAKPTTTPSS